MLHSLCSDMQAVLWGGLLCSENPPILIAGLQLPRQDTSWESPRLGAALVLRGGGGGGEKGGGRRQQFACPLCLPHSCLYGQEQGHPLHTAGMPCAAGLLRAGLSHRWVQSSGIQPAALVLHRHFYATRATVNFPSRSLGCCSGTSESTHLHQECSSLWCVSLVRERNTAVTLQQKRSHSELTAPCNRQSREERLTEESEIYMTAKPPGFFFSLIFILWFLLKVYWNAAILLKECSQGGVLSNSQERSCWIFHHVQCTPLQLQILFCSHMQHLILCLKLRVCICPF